MSRPIDYSKWDRFGDGESEDEHQESEEEAENPTDAEVEEHAAIRKPQVTRLDHPSSVTIGPDGLQVKFPEKASASPFSMQCPKFVSSTAPSTTSSTVHSSQTLRSQQCEADITDDLEDDLLLSKLSRDGQQVASIVGVSASAPYLWSQTRETVTLSIFLQNSAIRGSQIQNFRVTKLVDVTDCSTEGSSRVAFSVFGGGEVSLILRYPVKCDEERIEGCWNLHTLSSKQQKLMVIQLDKEDFANGVYLWWDRACIGETPIDTTKLEGRKQQSVEAQQKWSTVWEDAHKEFRRRVNERVNAS
mmetsp:Transcript_20299/g.23396  ORF Transcript_20299/g.23396 Transcript_20299/m.23396 type:complete len:302 (-) Transcript_20299:34-939(-)